MIITITIQPEQQLSFGIGCDVEVTEEPLKGRWALYPGVDLSGRSATTKYAGYMIRSDDSNVTETYHTVRRVEVIEKYKTYKIEVRKVRSDRK